LQAAKFIRKHRIPGLYRVHAKPDPDRFDELRLFLVSLGLKVPHSDHVQPRDFDRLIKQVADIMEAAYPVPGRGRKRVAEDATAYESMSPEELLRKAQQLEKKMLKHARDLEFEEAARLRDEIQRMREIGFGLSDKLAG